VGIGIEADSPSIGITASRVSFRYRSPVSAAGVYLLYDVKQYTLHVHTAGEWWKEIRPAFPYCFGKGYTLHVHVMLPVKIDTPCTSLAASAFLPVVICLSLALAFWNQVQSGTIGHIVSLALPSYGSKARH
jgi:hypothetical protein